MSEGDERSGLERRLAKTVDWLIAEDHFLPDCETIRCIREAAEAIGEMRRAMRGVIDWLDAPGCDAEGTLSMEQAMCEALKRLEGGE